MKKTAILLINLGTPDAPTIPAVRNYLNQFLMDPDVIDIPAIARFILVKGIILRFRPKQSAEAYKQIWTDKGSPLLVHSLELRDTLKTKLNNELIELGMRYGNPSIKSALDKLMQHKPDKLIVLPLFPQFSQAATQSALKAFHHAFKPYRGQVALQIIREFYDDPEFIQGYANLIQQHFHPDKHEHLLMSYHGLPVKHLSKTGCHHVHTHCKESQGCPPMGDDNRDCYRAQCYATSHAIADKLHLKPEDYSISFQSRLGRTPWIKPYTDFHLEDLRKRSITRLAIVCPSFVADCLETLEEIGIRAREQWLKLGGDALTVIPCLNANLSVSGLNK